MYVATASQGKISKFKLLIKVISIMIYIIIFMLIMVTLQHITGFQSLITPGNIRLHDESKNSLKYPKSNSKTGANSKLMM